MLFTWGKFHLYCYIFVAHFQYVFFDLSAFHFLSITFFQSFSRCFCLITYTSPYILHLTLCSMAVAVAVAYSLSFFYSSRSFLQYNAIAKSRIDAKWWKLLQSAHSPISTLMEVNTVWQTCINSLFRSLTTIATSKFIFVYEKIFVFLLAHTHTAYNIHNFISDNWIKLLISTFLCSIRHIYFCFHFFSNFNWFVTREACFLHSRHHSLGPILYETLKAFRNSIKCVCIEYFCSAFPLYYYYTYTIHTCKSEKVVSHILSVARHQSATANCRFHSNQFVERFFEVELIYIMWLFENLRDLN